MKMGRMMKYWIVAVLHLMHFSDLSTAMMDKALPQCAKPGFDMGMKSGTAVGGLGAAMYSALMSTCPHLVPHMAAAGAAATTGAAAATTVSMPGLMLGGPLAPVAAMVAAGMVGGAMIGGTAGSLISCREVGVQNDTHYMVQYKQVMHPDGFAFEMSNDGRYRPQRFYNHHVHPRPHMNFDYDEMDYMMNNVAMDGGGGGGGGNAANNDFGDYFYDRYHMSSPRRRKRPFMQPPYSPAYFPYNYHYPRSANNNYQRMAARRPRIYRQSQTFRETFPPMKMTTPMPPTSAAGPIFYPLIDQSGAPLNSNDTADKANSIGMGEPNHPEEGGFIPIDSPYKQQHLEMIRQEVEEQEHQRLKKQQMLAALMMHEMHQQPHLDSMNMLTPPQSQAAYGPDFYGHPFYQQSVPLMALQRQQLQQQQLQPHPLPHPLMQMPAMMNHHPPPPMSFMPPLQEVRRRRKISHQDFPPDRLLRDLARVRTYLAGTPSIMDTRRSGDGAGSRRRRPFRPSKSIPFGRRRFDSGSGDETAAAEAAAEDRMDVASSDGNGGIFISGFAAFNNLAGVTEKDLKMQQEATGDDDEDDDFKPSPKDPIGKKKK